jgi:DNA-binding transcriptional MerR regulator
MGRTLQRYVNEAVEPPRWLRPIDLGRAVGLSASAVRHYEQVGFLPPAGRSPAGYRRYARAHLEAIHVSRRLIRGYGWQRALAVMRAVHAGDKPAALAVVDACHADLHRQRAELEEVLHTIERTSLITPPKPQMRSRRPLRIGAAADLVGVRPSAVRFWEQQGLLQPTRDSTQSRYYDYQQLQRLQVVKLLRDAGYRFHTIRSILDDLATSQPSQVRAALERRRRSVEHASQRTMRATSALHDYLQTRDDALPHLSGS